jgi:hypothetical protein
MSSGERIERDPDTPTDGRPTVSASHTSPDRTVFTEQDNTEAWIATDLTVDLER